MAVDPDKPFNREEMYLAKAAGEGTTVPDEPWSRKEAYLDKISGRLDGIDEKIAALATDISLKGSVATETDLPSGAAVGDAYITEDTGVMYVWVGDEWVALGGTGINVVQTTGTSTTDVMSQDASTGLIHPYGYKENKQAIKIGIGSVKVSSTSSQPCSIVIGVSTSLSPSATNITQAGGQDSIAIGHEARATSIAGATAANMTGGGHIAIGAFASNIGSGNGQFDNIAIGTYAKAYPKGSIALGSYSNATQTGEMNIGTSSTSQGYNSSNYRLLTGLYVPQSDHDAATKGYVDGLVGNIETALYAINNGGNA